MLPKNIQVKIAGWESSVMNYAACRIFNLVAENNLAYTWSNCKLSSDLEKKYQRCDGDISTDERG